MSARALNYQKLGLLANKKYDWTFLPGRLGWFALGLGQFGRLGRFGLGGLGLGGLGFGLGWFGLGWFGLGGLGFGLGRFGRSSLLLRPGWWGSTV